MVMPTSGGEIPTLVELQPIPAPPVLVVARRHAKPIPAPPALFVAASF
jgi:hypothetical protein